MVDRIVSADPTGGPDRRATLPPMTAAARLVVVRGEHAVGRGAAFLAGGFTPTELFSTWDRGAAAVSVGGPILGDALAGGGLDALAARARRFVELCAGGGAA